MEVSEEKTTASNPYNESLGSSTSIHNSVQDLNDKEGMIGVSATVASISEEEEVAKKKEEETKEPFTIFPLSRLIQFLAITSLTGMISPLTASIYLPAVNSIEIDLGITTEQVNLTITVYMVFQALSTTFWGTLADSWGRRPVLLGTMLAYCVACIGLALAPNYAALVVFRMLQAFGSSSVIAVSAGVLSDIVQSDRRGSFYGFYSLGQLLGPVLGPVLGGIISQYLGWRWIFWILLMLGGTSIVAVFLFVPETLRSIVGNGSGYANPTPFQWLARRRGKFDEEKIAAIRAACGPRRKLNFLAPFIYLLEPDVFISLWFVGIVYSVIYCFMTSTTKQFSIHYPFLSELEIGVCFLAMGVGIILGSFSQGKLLDRRYKATKEKFDQQHPDAPASDFPIHKARLSGIWINLVVVIALTIIYGWMFHINAPLAVPLVLQFIVGLAGAGMMNTFSTLLVDLYAANGASITASNNLVRCTLGAIATVYIDPGIEGAGMGCMFTVMGIILAAHSICIPILIKFGPRWKQNRANRQNKTPTTKVGLLLKSLRGE